MRSQRRIVCCIQNVPQRHLIQRPRQLQQQRMPIILIVLFAVTVILLIQALIIPNSSMVFVISFTPIVTDLSHCSINDCLRKEQQLQLSTRSRQMHYYNTATMTSKTTRTTLFLLLDVPDDFFTITFPVLGILLSISKNFARIRMEERAWEQRLEDGRIAYMQRNPSVTEYDLRKKEAEQEWSAYGTPRIQAQKEQQQRQYVNDDIDEQQRRSRGRKPSSVAVMDRNDNDNKFGWHEESQSSTGAAKTPQNNSKEKYCMTDEEIELFELEYGILYDPYYDDPYTFDEVLQDQQQSKESNPYEIDKLYGDIIFQKSGEIFYKDSKTNLYYRQGSKPRNLSFFG